MISKTKILVFLLILPIKMNGQYFEGKITYQITYKSKLSDSLDQLFSALGSSQDFYIKKGNFKYVSTGELFQWQLYLCKKNIYYNKMSYSPIVYWEDCGKSHDKILKAEINTGVTEVLGLLCDELILTCENGVYKYYYNSKYKVDAKQFKNFHNGNIADMYLLSNSIILKTIVDNALFVEESFACEIQEIKLDDSIFILPKDIKIEKKLNLY